MINVLCVYIHFSAKSLVGLVRPFVRSFVGLRGGFCGETRKKKKKKQLHFVSSPVVSYHCTKPYQVMAIINCLHSLAR